MKGAVSRTGYKKNSPDKDNDYNIIPSGNITMEDVMHDVLGIDNLGNIQMMKPGGNYNFKGNKVLEIPMKNKNKNTNAEILNYPAELLLPVYQKAGEVITPDALKTLKRPADITKAEQKIARQYNLQGIPGTTERETWNSFLDWVESQGYTEGSEKLKALNKETNRFSELSDLYNQQVQQTLKDKYQKLSKNKDFNKALTEEKYIQSRLVTPEMMANAQKVYGQQTSKDMWFGSETARTFYPKISPVELKFTDVKSPQSQQKMQEASGKYVAARVVDYKTGKPVPFQGVIPIKGYDIKTGRPQYNLEEIQELTPELRSKVFYDPAFGEADPNIKSFYQSYLPQQKYGGQPDKSNPLNSFTKRDLKDALEKVIKKQFGGSTAPQGEDTSSYLEDKKNKFNNYLRKNVVTNMLHEELEKMTGEEESEEGMMQEGGEPNMFPSFPDTEELPPQTLTPEQEQQLLLQRYLATDITAGIENPFQTEAEVAAYNKTLTPSKASQWGQFLKNNLTPSNITTGVLRGMDMFSASVEQANAEKYQRQLQNQLGAPSLFPTLKGSRGDYDINSGMFRPDRVGTPVYQEGGEYEFTQEELYQFMAKGGQCKLIKK